MSNITHIKQNAGTYRVAIIGGGPRGLSALESLYESQARNHSIAKIETIVINDAGLFGAGAIYDTSQPNSNWLNISQRGLTLPERSEIELDTLTIPRFPSYHEWAGYDQQKQPIDKPDFFPRRSDVGDYLRQRFSSIAQPLSQAGLLNLIGDEVLDADWTENEFVVCLKGGIRIFVDEIALTVGHQSTKLHGQLSDWRTYSYLNHAVELFTDPYPVDTLMTSNNLERACVVSLRGFGLAMIDVMRALTIGRDGQFEIRDQATQEVSYIRSGKEPKAIIPFSLDGMPMAPKPVNLQIDRLYFPTDAEKTDLLTRLSSVAQQGRASDSMFLIQYMSEVIARVFFDLGCKAIDHNYNISELQQIILRWLVNEEFEHKLLLSRKLPPTTILEGFVGMATGTKKVTLDFCIGHVWRHCQPTLYKALSFSNLNDEVIASLVELDERLKRYSYGPPVESLQQLLALIKAGIVLLDYVNNPEINTTKKGWELSKGTNLVTANIMINTVLDPPKILQVDSPLIRHLLELSIVKPVHSELGVATNVDGLVNQVDGNSALPISVLGRLAKGTLLGVDAILECFNYRTTLWADGAVSRANSIFGPSPKKVKNAK